MSKESIDLPKLSYKALAQLPEPVFWFDEKGKFFEVNTLACETWGYSREEFLEMSIFDVNPNMNPETWNSHWNHKQKDTSTFESTHRRKNGEIFPVEITDKFVEFDGKVYACAIVKDITARKAADWQARLSDFTVQKAGDAIFWLCPKGYIKNHNEEVRHRYGYSEKELFEMNIRSISKETSEDDLKKKWTLLREKKFHTYEEVHFTKEGKKIDVEVSVHHIQFENMDYACAIVKDITERKRKEAALRGALMEIKELKEKLEAENNYLQEEIQVQNNFGEIISASPAFKKVLKQIEQVADTSSTVLVTGESGTGKELIARALHQLSRRSSRTMIKVNCAALPANLIESELFGHKKGAFTGALNDKIGKFELADGGTLFLDEIGELPIELQPKLLRALQEGEIERVGDHETKKVDVRIVAATNRNLQKEIEEGKFREDLYYRLNVFPIHCIPLRNRIEDVPLLVRFFCEKLGGKLGRSITDIPQKVIDRLMEYDYPGNIRELENLIERAIITSSGGKLKLGEWFRPKKKKVKKESFDSMEEMQRKYIAEILQHTEWRVSGENGAAKILGMRPTTLYSKMDRLGIKRSNELRNE